MERFKKSVVDCGDSVEVLVYDLTQRCVVKPLSNYSAAMSQAQLVSTTVSNEMDHLRLFWGYLSATNTPVADVNNEVIRLFRDQALDEVLKSPSYRGDEESAKATVNVKLRRIYKWLHWLQAEGFIRDGTVGDRCAVSSSVVVLEGSRITRTTPQARWNIRSSCTYPLEYKIIPNGSRHHVSQDIPTEETVDKLHEIFFSSTNDPYIAHRNCLIVDIASVMGLRRGSIHSLMSTEFKQAAIDAVGENEFHVRPKSQKFGYANTFVVPTWLAQRICDFSESHLRDFILRKKISPNRHKHRIFLSSRDGAPLADRSITKAVSAAMRLTGARKGSAIHVFRSKFASEEVELETEMRKEAGLDTSTSSIADVMAMKMGHRDKTQFLGYASRAQSKLARKKRAAQTEDIQKLKSENARLKLELAGLRNKPVGRSK
ncbi:hypothetical protein [Polaromonas aquatica]|uniref:hypothetical protein n=1 Tax=Polaromonas aquatica TaxID=332657 RepID=UPI003D654A1C